MGSKHLFWIRAIPATTILAALLSACATNPTETYNTTGPTGSLERQELTFNGRVCHYNTGLTIYTQGNCPATVQSNVYTR